MSLVEQGWSEDRAADCTPQGDCSTPVPGYYYRLYESTEHACETTGNHEFLVIDPSDDPTVPRNLFVKFLGGGVGFWYDDADGTSAHWPNDAESAVETAAYNRRMLFRAGLSAEHAQGVTRHVRETSDWRMVVVSYCSHDLYHAAGHDAALAAVNYVRANYATTGVVAYGGSAGAAGAFFVGDALGVDGIVMDSQAADLTAMRDACNAGLNVFGNSFPCAGAWGPNAYDLLAPYIGFEMGVDEPWRNLDGAPPVYLVWNQYDASRYTHLQYDNMHAALTTKGEPNVAEMVCIDDWGACNLHVPTGKDSPETADLVERVYQWITARVAGVVPEPTPQPTPVPEPTPIPSGDGPAWGSMLLPGWEGDRISAYDVLLTAESLGLDGMVATGAPSQDNAARYAALDGWIRAFLRGPFAQLANVDTVARQFGVPYTHIGYGPESSHQAGEEALDPLTWVPQAEALAESFGKGLIYGPAIMDWELRIATTDAERAALMAQIAPHVDIFMLQLGNYERWAKTGKDDAGNLFTWDDLYARVAWWVSTIKGANPDCDVWVQAGIGTTSGGKCYAPQPVSEFLAHRARLGAVGVDGLFVMPSQTCQLSTDPADHEAWLQSYEAFEQAVVESAQ